MLTLEPTRQGASQGPQDDYERYGRESGLQHAGGEIDGGLGRDPQVFGDAIFGVLVVAADEVELKISSLAEPAAGDVVVQPGAPAALGGEPQLHCQAPHGNAGGGKHRKEQSGHQYGRPAVTLQRIEKRSIPQVEQILDTHRDDDHENKRGGEHARTRAAAPILQRARPEPPQQIAPPHPFLVIGLSGRIRRGRNCWIGRVSHP